MSHYIKNIILTAFIPLYASVVSAQTQFDSTGAQVEIQVEGKIKFLNKCSYELPAGGTKAINDKRYDELRAETTLKTLFSSQTTSLNKYISVTSQDDSVTIDVNIKCNQSNTNLELRLVQLNGVSTGIASNEVGFDNETFKLRFIDATNSQAIRPIPISDYYRRVYEANIALLSGVYVSNDNGINGAVLYKSQDIVQDPSRVIKTITVPSSIPVPIRFFYVLVKKSTYNQLGISESQLNSVVQPKRAPFSNSFVYEFKIQ